jgi:hypothetical protein
MTHDSEADKHRFWALAKRYNQLGLLLPKLGDFDPEEDIDVVASTRLVLDEMHKTKSEMDALLARNDPRRPPS